MANRVRRNRWVEILKAVPPLIIGLVISPALERIMDPLFSIEVRSVLVVVLFLGLVVVIALAIATIWMRQREEQSEALARDIQDIQRKMGLSADFVYDLPRMEATGELYRRGRKIVEGSQKSIWALWYQRHATSEESESDARSEEWNKEELLYHQALTQKCREHKRDTFFYRRIVQIPKDAEVTGGILASEMLTPTMAQHCRELLDFVSDFPEAAVLKYAPSSIQQTFVLVDERYILWEIDAMDPDTGKNYMDGLLVFDDPNGVFTSFLRNFFLKLDAHSWMVKQIVD